RGVAQQRVISRSVKCCGAGSGDLPFYEQTDTLYSSRNRLMNGRSNVNCNQDLQSRRNNKLHRNGALTEQ
ncbi:MAG: hypothetical protein OEV84_05860, partial [Betaproteobacteria bacterium]|nr:hypothetical protein [Betaproteobacteria bacterium]